MVCDCQDRTPKIIFTPTHTVCCRCALVIDPLYLEYDFTREFGEVADTTSISSLFAIFPPKQVNDVMTVFHNFSLNFDFFFSPEMTYKHVYYILGRSRYLEFRWPLPYIIMAVSYLFFLHPQPIEMQRSFLIKQRGVRTWNYKTRMAYKKTSELIGILHKNGSIANTEAVHRDKTGIYSKKLLNGIKNELFPLKNKQNLINLNNIINKEQNGQGNRTIREICNELRYPVSSYYFQLSKLADGYGKPGPKSHRLNYALVSEVKELSKTLTYKQIQLHVSTIHETNISTGTISNILNYY